MRIPWKPLILVDTIEIQRKDRSKASECPGTGDIHYYPVRNTDILFDPEASLALG